MVNQSIQSSGSVDIKEIPVLVKILSILAYIGAGFMAILGLVFIFGAEFLSNLLQQASEFLPQANFVTDLGSALFVIIGIFFIGVAVLDAFVARGLWRGQNWARITEIVLLCLGMVSSLMSVTSGEFVSLIQLALNGLIVGYLIFSEDVKKAFAQN